MEIEGWKYYNHAALPTTAPHEEPNLKPVEDRTIWKQMGKSLLLARWTTDFDCKYETEWWYVIKEGPYLVEDLSSSQRKHIRQALKKCEVKIIDVEHYLDDLYRVHVEAVQRYKNWDTVIEREGFVKDIRSTIGKLKCWGAFSIETNILIGYMLISEKSAENYVEIATAKFSTMYLKSRVSDAMYHTILSYYLNDKRYRYASAGERSINHVTQTQEYKISNFKFRKAYCKLWIEYNPYVEWGIKMIYPLRGILEPFDDLKMVHRINAVLKMEMISRKSKIDP